MATRLVIQTEDDLREMPDDGQRYELFEGEIVVSPSPGRAHQKVVGRLHVRLQTFVETNHLGEVLRAPFDVKLAEHTIVQPDILFVSTSRSEALTEQRVAGGPDLVVEEASPSTRVRDEGVKMAVYAAAGVREYWLVDPLNRKVRLLTLESGRFQAVPHQGSTVSSAVLPGLEIDLAALFRDLS